MKTAVEWLAEQYNLVDTAEYEQAKEMEKQQKGYSDEEVLDLLYKRDLYLFNRDETKELELPNEWFELKKKK
jgi:hypothetical protein